MTASRPLIVLAVAAVLLAVGLSACGGGETEPTTEAATADTAATAAAETAEAPALAPENAAALNTELDAFAAATTTMMKLDDGCRSKPVTVRLLCEEDRRDRYESAREQAEKAVASAQAIAETAGPAGTTCVDYLGGFFPAYYDEWNLERNLSGDLAGAGDDADQMARALDTYHRRMLEKQLVDSAAVVGTILTMCRALANPEVGQSTLATDLTNYFYKASTFNSNLGVNLSRAIVCGSSPQVQETQDASREQVVSDCVREYVRLDLFQPAYQAQADAWITATANPGLQSISPKCAKLVDSTAKSADNAAGAVADLVEAAGAGGLTPQQIVKILEPAGNASDAFRPPRPQIATCIDEAAAIGNTGGA